LTFFGVFAVHFPVAAAFQVTSHSPPRSEHRMNLATKTLLAVLIAGTGPAVWAADSAPPAPPAGSPHAAFASGPFAGELMRALRQLNLTSDQRMGVRNILRQVRAQLQSQAQLDDATRQALANPGDPNFSAAVQQAQAAAAARIQQMSQVETQIYNLLNPQQKAQLPEVLAQISARMQQRRMGRGTRAGASS
jgi:Spy/CpxP family protein refolding chaperone